MQSAGKSAPLKTPGARCLKNFCGSFCAAAHWKHSGSVSKQEATLESVHNCYQVVGGEEKNKWQDHKREF
jgi:hypothetical protein